MVSLTDTVTKQSIAEFNRLLVAISVTWGKRPFAPSHDYDWVERPQVAQDARGNPLALFVGAENQ